MPEATCTLSRRPLKSACRAAVVAALSTAAASVLQISPLVAPADVSLGVLLAGCSLADARGPSASPDGVRVSSMISCLPMGRPRCGGELDRIAVTNWLSFSAYGALRAGPEAS